MAPSKPSEATYKEMASRRAAGRLAPTRPAPPRARPLVDVTRPPNGTPPCSVEAPPHHLSGDSPVPPSVPRRSRRAHPKLWKAIEAEGAPGRKNSLTLAEKVHCAQLASLWQDKSLRFERDRRLLALVPGEEVLSRAHKAEDVRGGEARLGTLFLTSLRVLWLPWRGDGVRGDGFRDGHVVVEREAPNLSVGLASLLEVVVNPDAPPRRGQALAEPQVTLSLLCKHEGAKFQFVFACPRSQLPRLERTRAVWKAFTASAPLRDLSLRTAGVRRGEVALLPGERPVGRLRDVTNLAHGMGNPGTFLLTSARVVWFSARNEAFNVTVPWTMLLSVRVRTSRFGLALVLETAPRAGGYLLGFGVEPPSRLGTVHRELRTCWRGALARPTLGTGAAMGADDAREEDERERDAAEFSAVDEGDGDPLDGGPGGEIDEEGRDEARAGRIAALGGYALPGERGDDAGALGVWSPELGLAVENPGGVTLQELWTTI